MRKKLSERLEQILSEIPHCKVLFDVGCDHGFLGCAALERNLAEQVVFSDISEASLEKAKRLVNSLQLLQRARFVCGPGLEHVGYADVAVIAGMGGREIARILSGRLDCAGRFVLQPMKNAAELRASLSGHVCVSVDRRIRDGDRFYDLLSVTAGSEELSDLEIRYGKSNLVRPGKDFLSSLARRKEMIRDALSAPVGKMARERLEREWMELKELEEKR